MNFKIMWTLSERYSFLLLNNVTFDKCLWAKEKKTFSKNCPSRADLNRRSSAEIIFRIKKCQSQADTIYNALSKGEANFTSFVLDLVRMGI